MMEQKWNIAILGTRGIPNRYGGFEQFAEQFAVRMVLKGHNVSVYAPHHHPYKEEDYKGVHLIRRHDPEAKLGTAGQFVYDLNCILDSRKRNFDIILQLGYTSSTMWWRLLPRRSLIVTNMDGLEWKRSKYNRLTRWYLRQAERWGALHSDYLIADSKSIKTYLDNKFNRSSVFIPYGAEVFSPRENAIQQLQEFLLNPFEYDLLIARFEPENNIEIALQTYVAEGQRTLVLVGSYDKTKFGSRCYSRFSQYSNIRFVNGIYDGNLLNTLRYYSRLYIHGHSVGGTNPSLLEAMACGCLIAAHNNTFNHSVLEDHALYFDSKDSLLKVISREQNRDNYQHWIQSNREKINSLYNWDSITNDIKTRFGQWLTSGKR